MYQLCAITSKRFIKTGKHIFTAGTMTYLDVASEISRGY